jgi:hypothetical protein
MTVEPLEWESTGRTDDTGREIKFLKSDGRSKTPSVMIWVAGALTFLSAVAAGVVSYHAQYTFLIIEKGNQLESALGAVLLDLGAIVFALLGLALALNGHKVLAPRALNLACVAGSIYMNTALADLNSVHSIAAWSSPAIIYAFMSDRLIAVVHQMTIGPSGPGVLAAAHGFLLWLLRLIFHPITTLKGFRDWTSTLPSAPGFVIAIPEPTIAIEEPSAPPITVERVPSEAIARPRALMSVPDARTDRVIAMLAEDDTLTGAQIGERFGLSAPQGRKIKAAAIKQMGGE